MKIVRFLDNIIVIGGGRWARVLTQVICDLVPPTVSVFVYSLHNAKSMRAWAGAQGLGNRLQVSSEWPQDFPVGSNAAIVVNAARDHEKTTEWALSADIPVLTEKPMALTATAAQRLADLAESRKGRLAVSHIFLFAGYVEHFAKMVIEAGTLHSLRISWTDPLCERRYGESKHYDPGLPIFLDCLPHVLSIASALTSNSLKSCELVTFLRGGAHLEIDLMMGNVPCSIHLVRNGDRRLRFVEAITEQGKFQLDFSQEPGTITQDSKSIVGDPDWQVRPRPAARMLTAFFKWATGGDRDARLGAELGLQACRVMEGVADQYRSKQAPWLLTKLSSAEPMDEDLHYALNEMLQYNKGAKGLS